jgi:HK97 gp10 family phage protein
MAFSIKLDTQGLQTYLMTMPLKVDEAVRATAFQIEATAKTLSPYDTGDNSASIYSKTSKGNSGTPGDLGDILPAVDICEAVIGPSMEYSAHLEWGTRRMPARPYMVPAAEGNARNFIDNLRKALDK